MFVASAVDHVGNRQSLDLNKAITVDFELQKRKFLCKKIIEKITKFDFILKITKAYEVRATTMKNYNAFTPTLCFAQDSRDRWSEHAWSYSSDRRSKRQWSNCFMSIPFILSGSPNECWLHTCDACAITTWRLGLRAPILARKNLPQLNKSNSQILRPDKYPVREPLNFLR